MNCYFTFQHKIQKLVLMVQSAMETIATPLRLFKI